MQIAILTLGTRGDVQPFVALGRALRARGHGVRLCTCERFREFIEASGLEYGFQDDALLDFVESDRLKTMVEEGQSGPLAWIRAAIESLPQVKQMQRDMLRAHWESARGADLVIHHPKALAGPHIAEALGVPAVVVPPYPAYIPTREFPSLIFPRWPLGGLYNLATYKFAHLASSMASKITDEFRRESLGLPKQRPFDNPWLSWRKRRVPVVHPVSRHLLPQPEDWPDHAIVSGYWILDEDADPEPPAALRDFLAAGSAPVYIGFGSMSGKTPERRSRIVLEAVLRAGVRAIFATGWGGLAPQDVPEQVLVIDEAPHRWLFPRCAAVVHHGGAGTTAAGLLAGRPTLICPFFVDQPFWAERVRRLGVGPPPIPQRRLDALTLSAALSALVNDRHAADRAAEIGRKIEKEDGIAVAIEFMRRHACKQL